MRVCANPNCEHGGEPQPDDNFWRHRYRCKDCDRQPTEYSRGRRRRERDRRRSPIAVEREGFVWIPVKPWSKWLMDFQHRNQMTQAEISELFGTSKRRIYGWTVAQDTEVVNLDLVDRCLCTARMPEVLREIYPSLYSTDKETAA